MSLVKFSDVVQRANTKEDKDILIKSIMLGESILIVIMF
jgi:hypothetical protein